MWDIKKIISKGDYLYALVPEHPNATKNGYVLMHRIVVENHLGRLLNGDEIVHHIDGNKKNNSIENLQVLDNINHSRLHRCLEGQTYVKLKCPNCGKEFEKEKRKTFLTKKYKYNCTCCSKHCRGVLYRKIQLYGLTTEINHAISENFLSEYKKYI